MTFKGCHISARQTCIFTIGAMIALSEPICAQTVPPTTTTPTSVAPAVAAEPNMTTASFGDWTLRCQRLGNEDKVAQLCEVAETIQIQGQTTPVAQVAIGRIAPTGALKATVVLPTAISFPSIVQIYVDKDASPLELDWRRCLPGGCFAYGGLKDDEISRWRAQTQPGRITFKDANGREIAIPLSFRGLTPALDALLREKTATLSMQFSLAMIVAKIPAIVGGRVLNFIATAGSMCLRGDKGRDETVISA